LQQPATTTVHVPLVLRNWPAATHTAQVVFGTQFAPFQEEIPEMYADVVAHDLPRVQQAGFTSIRTHVYWRDIEPANTTPDTFNWAGYDQRLGDYREYGLDPLVGIVGYPKWATRYACGGGLLEGMAPEWRQFVRALAERYSAPPYNVRLWEIGNEVDGETEVDPTEDSQRPPDQGGNEPTWPFGGCWGDMASEYVEFLRIAYQEIKAVDPDATVMPGSLAYAEFGHWFIQDFFDNFLAAGGAAYTDVVGFHWFKSFQVWPTAVDKARELRGIMAARGVDKPLWLTETYMPDRAQDNDRRQERYNFITQEMPRALGSGEIERVYWYSFSDWPAGWSDIDRGLVTREHQPKPGLRVFEIMREYVDGISGPENMPGVEAYRFRRPDASEESWVLWSINGETHATTLPAPRTTVTAERIVMGDSYATTRSVPVDVVISGGQAHIPVGPETVFVQIHHTPTR
ncbi:MAG: glycosyl hydrolase, partial [Anaerolineae bacterium]